MHELSMYELEATSVELLPSRETLAFINIANVTAVNLAIAVNTLTFGSTAAATAVQGVVVMQS
jgi:hypothetical protein